MNKKLFTAIFALVIVFALLAFAGCTTDDDPDVTDPGEETDQNSEFNFSELSDGSYEVTGFSDDYDGAAEIVIPSEHNGKPVTAIGDHAFGGCSGLTSITFQGTKRQWSDINKRTNWNSGTGNYTMTCTDGVLD